MTQQGVRVLMVSTGMAQAMWQRYGLPCHIRAKAMVVGAGGERSL